LFWRNAFVESGPSAVVSNNLFWGTTVEFEPVSEADCQIFNNAFDNCVIESFDLYPVANGSNAFINCEDIYGHPGQLLPTNNATVVLTNFEYAPGPLGNFYQLSTDLINLGSTTADQAGLYHYTTQTNQYKEESSVVDIGFHYVAVGNDGRPVDTDQDGIPDYIEDRNGNGHVYPESGEGSWTPYFDEWYSDIGLKVWITQPKQNVTLP